MNRLIENVIKTLLGNDVYLVINGNTIFCFLSNKLIYQPTIVYNYKYPDYITSIVNQSHLGCMDEYGYLVYSIENNDFLYDFKDIKYISKILENSYKDSMHGRIFELLKSPLTYKSEAMAFLIKNDLFKINCNKWEIKGDKYE